MVDCRSVAGALALGYANIFVTAPSPENLRTLFDFVFKGLDAAGYQEHIDYDLVESTNPEWGRAVVRINVFRNHRQVRKSDGRSESEQVRQRKDKVYEFLLTA
jgi:tRNA(Met) C34 N-acetyltransferase TmcA